MSLAGGLAGGLAGRLARGLAGRSGGGPTAWEVALAAVVDLFGPSDDGFLWMPTLANMRVNDDGSGGAVAPDGVIGQLLDLSGKDNHAICAVSAAKPLYKTTGGRNFIKFDGVDDYLYHPSLAISLREMTLAVFAETDPDKAGNPTSNMRFLSIRPATGSDFDQLDGGYVEYGHNIVSENGVNLAIGTSIRNLNKVVGEPMTPRLFFVETDTGNNQWTGHEEAYSASPASLGSAASASDGGVAIGKAYLSSVADGDPPSASPLQGNIFGAFYIDRELNSTERAAVRTLMILNAGVTPSAALLP